MLLAIDIGNSYIKCAVFEQNTLLNKFIFKQDEAQKNFKKILKKYEKVSNGVISSVANLDENTISYLKKNINLLEISNKTPFPFSNNYKTKETLGIDRLVLSAGAVLSFKNQNRLIIDAGTCITYDYVDSNNVYQGGAISPGLSLRYNSLNTYTAKLPLLENKEIDFLIGKSTSESIYSGVINGVINEIDGFITQYKELNKDLTIILTGGDAVFLAKSLKNTIFANSNFLLESLNNLYTYCNNKND
ncbi:type III pantothenate kinase [Flavobacterium sp. N2270]|uniref:type III pantothenate kinase n=1 Tax=Flavobacterium sp. N2270 TaxID=2986831 RepID=UPI00222549B9|nr:type III pantothenate kinase [Flavobacterium sp. N2270]